MGRAVLSAVLAFGTACSPLADTLRQKKAEHPSAELTDEKTVTADSIRWMLSKKAARDNFDRLIENPNLKVITERYSPIPDISWVQTDPEFLYIPPKTSEDVEVVINIPIDQQEMYYNEKWETRVVITSDIPLSSGGGMNFQVELAVKLYIITPKGEQGDFLYIFIILFFIISIIAVFMITSYIKKKKDSAKSIYYFKNKK